MISPRRASTVAGNSLATKTSELLTLNMKQEAKYCSQRLVIKIIVKKQVAFNLAACQVYFNKGLVRSSDIGR